MLILAAVLSIFVYGMIVAMLGTILPDLSQRFGLTPKQNGSIALTQAGGLIIASLLVGPLIDIQGKKTGLVLGLAIITITVFLLPQARGFGRIATCLFLVGLGGGIILTGANALVSDISPDRRATALTLLSLFFGLGGLATPFISANLLRHNSVRLCQLVGILSAVALAVNAIAPIPPPAGRSASQWSGVEALVGSGSLWLLAGFLFLYVAVEMGVWNWLARHLIAQGIPESRALNILSLGFALGLLLGRLVVSPILISVPASAVTLAASTLMVVATYLMLQASSPAVAWVAVFGAGVAMAPVFPTALAMVGDLFPQRSATAMGMAITFGFIGLAVSSRVIGAIAGQDPKRLKKALLLLPASSAIMVAISLALREFKPR